MTPRLMAMTIEADEQWTATVLLTVVQSLLDVTQGVMDAEGQRSLIERAEVLLGVARRT